MKYAGILAVTLAFSLSGCASLGIGSRAENENTDNARQNGGPQNIELTGDFSRSKLIAADFVATLTQLPETGPGETVLHTRKPETRFGTLLLSALQRAGYDLRMGSDGSPNWLAYTADQGEALSDYGNPIYTFIVSAGAVKLKRSYEVDQHGVRPAGSMFVRGADTDNVVLDDSIFSVKVPPAQIAEEESLTEPAPVPQSLADGDFTDDDEVQLSPVPAPKPFVRTREVAAPSTDLFSDALMADIKQASSVSPSLPDEKVTGDNADPFSQMSNMYETQESRYKEIFKHYDIVESSVLVFPDDSLILGQRNKQQLQVMASRFNPDTDLMSVIGCSHGTTKIQNGNAYLANNRAFRVKEEFVANGLGVQQVLEEGCWAGVSFDKMPDRGVLVQHKRIQ